MSHNTCKGMQVQDLRRHVFLEAPWRKRYGLAQAKTENGVWPFPTERSRRGRFRDRGRACARSVFLSGTGVADGVCHGKHFIVL